MMLIHSTPREEPAKTEERKESSGKAETPPEKVQQNFSRALDVAYGGSSSASSNSGGSSSTASNTGERGGTAVTNRQRFSLLMQGNPRSFLKLRAFLMTLTFSFLKIPRLSARWTDDLFLIWLASWSVRLMRTYTVQTGM